MNAETIARALGGARRGRDGWWRARCPCHSDSSPSFAVKDRDDGAGVLVECFAGCERDDLVAELSRRNLWPNRPREKTNEPRERQTKKTADWQPVLPVPADAPHPTFEHSLGRPSSAWNYADAAGRLLGYVCRFNKAGGKKEFRSYICCRGPDSRLDWRWKGFPEPRPLYRLDRLAERPDDWVLIVEGEKTADAAADLFPDHVVITSPGGAKAAAKADLSPLKDRQVAIWGDADAPGRAYAEDVAGLARKAGATKVVIVDVPDYFRKPDGSEGWDLADPSPNGWDVDGLRRLLDEAAFGKDTPVPDFTTVLDQAAELDSVSYDRRRDELAEKLGIRKSTLDAEVAKRRQERQEEKGLFLVEPPAWEQPVDGAALLDAIVAELRRYLVMPEHAPEAVALWILHAHAHDAFQCSPILAVVSPEKRCGKSRTLDVIRNLVPKGVFTSNTSPAAVFRIIEKYAPTLLVDKMDTFLGDNDELRGVINSGHQRSGAFVMRVSGDELEPKLYSTWGPKVLALIGRLPGTLADRSVEIPMKRKHPEERVARFRAVRPGNLPNIKRQCIRWAQDHLITLRDAALEVYVPEGLNDRAADNWEPLIAIADRVGGEWPDRTRKAALALSGKGAAEDGSIGVTLLSDIKEIFERRALTVSGDLWTRIPSSELAEKLAAIEGRPWAEWKGKPLTKNSLARLLAPFCIRPKDLRFGPRNASGYELSAFSDAFARYLPPEPPPATPTTPTRLNQNGNLQTSTPTDDNDVGLEKPENANGNNGVGDVGVEIPPPEGNDKDEDNDDGDADAPWELTV